MYTTKLLLQKTFPVMSTSSRGNDLAHRFASEVEVFDTTCVYL